MAEFKVGDRVRLAENYALPDYPRGREGTVRAVDSDDNPVEALLYVDNWTGIYAHRFELVGPHKDTPKVGDTVRVVLEGKVGFRYRDDGLTIEGGEDRNAITISPSSGLYKSIEIITPAKLSVTDLPARTVVKSKGDLWRRDGATDWWKNLDRMQLVKSAVLDAQGWTQLVPKGSE